jgi:tartronate-semialdehyde synthase
MIMKAAEAFVRIIQKEGIRDIFGIPGAGINGVYKFLKDAPIKHYLMRHEEACVHAADGYFKASHRIALAICTSGPGATNFVTGLYSAKVDSIPLLAVTGQANSWQLEEEAFQCVDIVKICEPIVKKAWCVKDAQHLPDIMKEAFFLMRDGRPGPVLIDLPLDIQNADIEFDIDQYEPAAVHRKEPAAADIDRAAKMIDEAKKPLIIMGGGTILSEGEDAVIRLAEQLRVPIITTYMAKGGVPIDHPLNAGHAGIQVGQPIGNKYFLESDLIIGIGCRFTDRHTGDLTVYRRDRKFIHIDICETQIGRVFAPDLGIVADARLAAEALLAKIRETGQKAKDEARAASVAADRVALRRKTDFNAIPMLPHRVFHEINETLDSNTIYTTGCGITQIWSGQLQDVEGPRLYLPSGGAGTLGFEIPAAFGAKVAYPEQPVCAVVGDFGFTFMGEEIAVAAAFGKPIIIVIVNNAYLGLIVQNQKGAYGYEYCVDMPYNQDGLIDYLKVAEGFGCAAERVFTPEELKAALARAKTSDKPYVIDAICSRDQLCDMGPNLENCKTFVSPDTE